MRITPPDDLTDPSKCLSCGGHIPNWDRYGVRVHACPACAAQIFGIIQRSEVVEVPIRSGSRKAKRDKRNGSEKKPAGS